MKYVDRLLSHPEYIKFLEEIEELEKDRIYCLHGLPHALDVCRIAWMMYLEDSIARAADGPVCCDRQGNIDESKDPGGSLKDPQEYYKDKEKIYLAGLLHDVGRTQQYKTGEHHLPAGIRKAESLLREIGYPREDSKEILGIIACHSGRCAYGTKRIETQNGVRDSGCTPGTQTGDKKHGVENETPKDSCKEISITYYIKRADHISRNCFSCKAAGTCKWAKNERNETVWY